MSCPDLRCSGRWLRIRLGYSVLLPRLFIDQHKLEIFVTLFKFLVEFVLVYEETMVAASLGIVQLERGLGGSEKSSDKKVKYLRYVRKVRSVGRRYISGGVRS